MSKQTKTLTVFGKDLDSLLKRAGKFTLHEYADECAVSYKYLTQLRTIPERRPGRLYVDLLKPFVRLRIIDLVESQRLSLKHRSKPLSFTECRELFSDFSEPELLESVRKSTELFDLIEVTIPTSEATWAGASNLLSLGRQGQLYRHVFVGRQAELNELRIAFDEAAAGQGAVVMVSGEPGIGKTALCSQLANYTTSRHGISIIGHCYEPGSLSIPYMAFVEILRSYVVNHEAASLTKELGTGAGDIARIIPELTHKLGVPVEPHGNPAEEKYRLLQSITDFLGNISVSQPVLLIFEDLHGADSATLDMLQFLARRLGSKRILIIGTYRDIEVNIVHPLSEVLAELKRLSNFGQIQLQGLNIDEVARMLSGIFGKDTPAGLSIAVHGQTEGNPLFVESVARYLIEEGLIDRSGELTQTARDLSFVARIPVGLRDVIGKRLSGLSKSCSSVLSVASVIGRDFRLDILKKVTGISEEKLSEALREAYRAALIEEHIQLATTLSYRFTHAFFRQTLYEDIIGPKRIKLHRQIAYASEILYSNHLEEHAEELAQHFAQSTHPPDLVKAVFYGEMAARRASDIYAYVEAVRLLSQVIKIQAVLDHQDKTKRCDLLLTMCDALWLAGEPRHILDIEAPAALALAEEINDRERTSRVCMLAMWAITVSGAGTVQAWMTEEAALWAERANRYAEPDTRAHAWADVGLGMTKISRAQMGGEAAAFIEGLDLLRQAIDEGRRLRDPEIIWIATVHYLCNIMTLDGHEERLQLAEEMAGTSRNGISLFTLGTGLLFAGFSYLEAGNRQQVEQLWQEHQQVTQRTDQPYYRFQSMQIRGNLAYLDGRLFEAQEIFRNIQTYGDQIGLSLTTGIIAAVGICRALLYLGEAEEALRLVSTFLPYPLVKAVCLAYLSKTSDVEEILRQQIITRSDIGSTIDLTFTSQYVLGIEASVIIGHRESATRLLQLLSNSGLVTTGIVLPTCVPRHLGGATVLLGRYEQARQHYQKAIRVCTEMRFRPELALSRLQLAELLLEHYPDEKKAALEHLDFAIKEFREMKMQPSLERALRHKDILKA